MNEAVMPFFAKVRTRCRYYSLAPWDQHPHYLARAHSGQWVWLLDEPSAASFHRLDFISWLLARHEASCQGRTIHREVVS